MYIDFLVISPAVHINWNAPFCGYLCKCSSGPLLHVWCEYDDGIVSFQILNDFWLSDCVNETPDYVKIKHFSTSIFKLSKFLTQKIYITGKIKHFPNIKDFVTVRILWLSSLPPAVSTNPHKTCNSVVDLLTSLSKYLVLQAVSVSARCLSSVLCRSSRILLCSVAFSMSFCRKDSVTCCHRRLKWCE